VVKVRYDVTLERQPSTVPNPFGLGVVTQVIYEDVDPQKER
jgi:hypothetical protein